MSFPREPAQLLSALVGIESPSGAEQRIADYVVELLQSWSIDVERVGHSIVASVVLGSGPRLLFNSHLDTVPIGANWTRDPLAAVWEGQRLFGRGANDAKVSVVAMLFALRAVAEARIARGTLQLALTECEETSNLGMTRVLERIGAPDAAVTGEPTGLEVVRAQSGLAVLTAEWRGRSCHAAHVARVPHENALLAGASELVHTAPWMTLEGSHPLLGESTVATTVFKSGERHNVVPDRAEALFDARLSPLHTAENAAELLRSRMPRAAVAVKSARLKPFETAEDHTLVRTALRVAGRARAIGSSTLSDMALLQGVPAVKCGPGETARSHTPDEFVLRSELDAGVDFYTRLAPAVLEALALASTP
ncbi:MAG: M20/M25/M40 family metallo-hydrolase [Planctomycetes bacterium]|nr:M20/M25/M40 family metallo-hydrolase [Planctomycetota bacterium]